MHSKLDSYTALVDSWPGLVSGPAGPLVEDSLVLLDHLGSATSLVDVGSGGGMPGLPLKIARPELRVALVEADRRKAAFLVHAAARLALDVEVVAERAETAARGALRESFDAAACRALAPMPVLAELCLPFVRGGGPASAGRPPTGRRPSTSPTGSGTAPPPTPPAARPPRRPFASPAWPARWASRTGSSWRSSPTRATCCPTRSRPCGRPRRW